MPRKGHTEEQIVHALRQIEGGKKVIEVSEPEDAGMVPSEGIVPSVAPVS